MATKEAPNTLLSNSVFRVLDLLCEGPIAGFAPKTGPYGSDPLCSTYYDDVPVRNPDGSYNFNITGAGYSFNWTRGFSDQTGITGFQKVETIIPLSSNTRIANPPVGAGPFKPVIASFTSNTYPDADAVKVTVRVPALLAQDDNGNTNPYEIAYAVDLSINNGAFVQVGDEYIGGKCTSPYQKTTIYQLPKSTPASAYYEWKVRVRRVSQNILSIRTQNEIFVDSISVISTSLYAYPNSVLVGTQIGADQFSNIPSRAYEIKGLLVSTPSGYTPTTYGFNTSPFTRQCDYDAGNIHVGFTTQSADQALGITAGIGVAGAGIAANSIVTSVAPGDGGYFFGISPAPTETHTDETLTFTPTETVATIAAATYPTVWDGTFTTGVWTDNPAWVFYDILTSRTHGLGDTIPASYVDKWTLYEIAQYCDQLVDDGAGGQEPRFTCNAVIQQPDDAYTVLLNLASTFRGMLYYANGGIHASQDQSRPPVFAFNNSNVVNGVFNYSDTAKNTRSTVAKVKWLDPQNGYRENVEYIEDTEGILRYGYQEKEMTAFATTSRGQAYRLGSWTLQSERLLTETITFQTDLEGVALRPGDNFAVYDNFRNNRAQAGRITSFSSGHSLVTLDRSVAIEPGYTYSLNCIVPKQQLDGTGDVTGSTQIANIRASQVESFLVTTAATSGTTALIIAGSFSSNLYQGSPFILAASGQAASVFNRASFYTCLATAEVEPGKIEILGLQANTGVQFAIQTGYTVVEWPENPGDIYTPILPPSSLRVTGVTGADADNTFYSAISLTWVNTPSTDLSHYIVSGKEWDTAYELLPAVIGTGTTFTRGDTGQYLFRLAAVSHGGVESTFITGGFLVDTLNPLGTLRPLSGVRLVDNPDPLYVNAVTGYTGFVGINPGFSWTIPVDENDLPIVDAQFISGYQWVAESLNGVTGLATGEIGSPDETYFQFTGDLLRQWVTPTRGFNFKVNLLDIYGNSFPGGNVKVNNPPMKPPFASGFVGFNGGLIYNVTPSVQYDTSGIFLWVNQSPSFTPTYSNYNFSSSNVAGNAQIAPQTGSFYTWFALSDTFAKEGNPIWGPVSGNANGIFDPANLDISAQINNALADISGAFSLITGQITNSINIISGENQLTLQTVQGLSGQITGNGTIPGAVNTALNVRVNTIVVSSSGALSQQIDAVSARLQTTGQSLNATVGAVSTALTNTGVALGSRIDVVTANFNTLTNNVTATGATLLSAMATSDGALAQWITNLGVQTSGQTSAVQIGAQAFVTGSVNGLGGAAIASWGFKLNANGKVTSMIATAANGYGFSDQGTIVFGNADLQSDTFSEGSAGWRIKANGKAEFSDAIVRGTFTGGAGSAKIAINQTSVQIGNLSNRRFVFNSDGSVMEGYDSSNNQSLVIESSQGSVTKFGGISVNENGSYSAELIGQDGGTLHLGPLTKITMKGSDGSINCDTLDVDSTSNFDGDMTLPGSQKIKFTNGGNTSVYLDESNGLRLHGDSSHPVQIVGSSADLEVANDCSAVSFTTTSARRFKENIVPLSGALTLVGSLTGHRFDWINRDVKNDFGFIADDVAHVLPTAVHYDVSGQVKGVDYGRMTAVLVEATKDLHAEVRDLRAEVTALKGGSPWPRD